MPIAAIDQVGFVVPSIEMFAHRFTGLAGIGGFEVVEPGQFRTTGMILRDQPASWTARAAFAHLGSFAIELIEPREGASMWHEHLAAHGPGLHHLGCRVEDLQAEIQRFDALGVRVLQRARNIGRSSWAYLDTEQSLGIILELRQLE